MLVVRKSNYAFIFNDKKVLSEKFKLDMSILPQNLLFRCKIHSKITLKMTYFRKFSRQGHHDFNFLPYVIMISR